MSLEIFPGRSVTKGRQVSFFKSSKKKDATEHEHMSHQYRAWRDHLAKCLSKYMPLGVDYTLLHSANLVGLFTCIFIKNSERRNVKDLRAAEVKCGMGGLHGNKVLISCLQPRIVLTEFIGSTYHKIRPR